MGWSLDDMEEMERIRNQGITLNRCRLGGQRKGVLTTSRNEISPANIVDRSVDVIPWDVMENRVPTDVERRRYPRALRGEGKKASHSQL